MHVCDITCMCMTMHVCACPAGHGEGQSEGGSSMSSALQSTSQQAQKLFGYMKDGAGSFFKNIKESSSKAISAMAA